MSERPAVGGWGAAVSGFALFAIIGATSAMYGATIPSFRATFHLTAATAGLLLSGHFSGSLIGTIGPGFLPLRIRGPRPVTAASILCFALGCAVIGLAPAWPVPLAGAVVEGVGWGGLVIVFNALFASGFGRHSAGLLLVLNAVFSLGSILGPAGVGLLAGGSFREGFLAPALLSVMVLPFVLTLPAREAGSGETGAGGRVAVGTLLVPLGIFMAAFFLYSGLESGIGAWETTQLVATGLSAATAATVTSLFWAGFTAGRLLAAPLAWRVRPERLMLLCLATAIVLALLASQRSLTAAAYTLCGLVLAPLFPLGLIWSQRIMPASQRITSFVITGDLLGGATIPALLGQLVTGAGVSILPFAFALVAFAALCLVAGLRLITTSAASGSSPDLA